MFKNLCGWASKLAVLIHASADGISLGCTSFPLFIVQIPPNIDGSALAPTISP